ncbi:hypothetical protein H6771_00830 [Candidatus Peribacteria bacterium]|nr:hypothetical protein [Candidatus Peribacteria bacterium]
MTTEQEAIYSNSYSIALIGVGGAIPKEGNIVVSMIRSLFSQIGAIAAVLACVAVIAVGAVLGVIEKISGRIFCTERVVCSRGLGFSECQEKIV